MLDAEKSLKVVPSAGLAPGPPRRILCVFPRYTPAFGMFHYAYPLTDGVKALMPPQGLLLIAAVLPVGWEVRFVDENIKLASDDDFRWADAVFASGMHAQRHQIDDICERVHAHGKTAVLGGSSVSACPEYYPDYDYLHVGELGDATLDLFDRLSRDPSRPQRQIILKTDVRRDLDTFPPPAYELADLDRYLTGSVQFSSGCPYQCEFCDIPNLYGRNPRLKTADQIIAELDKMLAQGWVGGMYFVDDNFIGNRKAALEVLPPLIAWQKKNGYPFIFTCEATLNIAKRPEILRLMREAMFETVFCGIETPEPAALQAISKDHNMMVPMMEAIETLNSYGIDIVSGIIMGFDTDTPDTGKRISEFIHKSKIPMLTVNLLQALPRTPLWDRLTREGRLIEDETRESNVDFKLPYDDVLRQWRETMGEVFSPEALYARYTYQWQRTYPNRIKVAPGPHMKTKKVIRRGLLMLSRVLWHAGVKSDYRRTFWRFAWPALKQGDIKSVISVGLLSYHMILSAREAAAGQQSASHYSVAPRANPVAATAASEAA